MTPRRMLSLEEFRGATIIGMIVVNHLLAYTFVWMWPLCFMYKREIFIKV
jgi:predicted acyltransferase